MDVNDVNDVDMLGRNAIRVVERERESEWCDSKWRDL